MNNIVFQIVNLLHKIKSNLQELFNQDNFINYLKSV